jgi:hypothetical protein
MDTRTIAPNPNVAVVTSSARLTPSPPRATTFGEDLANTAVTSAESVMTKLPGGPMMALAVRGGAASVPLGTSTSALTTPGTGVTGGVPGATPTSAEGPGAGAGTSGIPGVPGTGADPTNGGIEASLQQSQEMNLYMLNVQQQVQQQNQQFTTLSNCMKAQHDTVKTAIGNIR